MQRVCFCKTVSLFNHVLQPSQAIALFYQTLVFSVKNLALIRWISSNIDVPTGLQLLMIDLNGNVTIDDELLYKYLSNGKNETDKTRDSTSILKWISRIVLRLASDCSISSKSDRSLEFESFNDFLKQFHTMRNDDRSTLSDDDEGISNDELDEEDISRRAIHRALMKCIDYTSSLSTTNNNDNQTNNREMQDFESNSVALYNQQIIQILCSDTLELEIELARDLRKTSIAMTPTSTNNPISCHDSTFYSIWASNWHDVTIEYLRFNGSKKLRQVSFDEIDSSKLGFNETRRWSSRENDRVLDEIAQRQQNLRKTRISTERKDENPGCLHDRLMFEIKQQRVLRPIQNQSIKMTTSFDSPRKRIRPIQSKTENDFSSDDDDFDQRDEHGRKRVVVIDCLLESSPDENSETKPKIVSLNDEDYVDLTLETLNIATSNPRKIDSKSIENLQLEYISMDEILRLIKDNSNSLSLTFDEFCHIRNVITRAELETLLFDEKLYGEVAQGKLCFTCRKVHFNLLTLTFGIQCYVCKQKICRQCATQIALPKDKLDQVSIKNFSQISCSKVSNQSNRSFSVEQKTPSTPTMSDVFNETTTNEIESRRCSTPTGNSTKNRTEPIDICTDCFFLLEQIREQSRERHVKSANLPAFSSRSTSIYNLSSSSSSSPIAALLAQQQNSFMVKSNSIHSNFKQIQLNDQTSLECDPMKNLTTIGATGGSQRVTLSRRHLFLKLQPAYDFKMNNQKSE